MIEYYKLPEATSLAIDTDGWLHLGDLGAMDDRGFVRITGRLKDMIIRGGINIYPREIEELLETHPAVAEAAVIGVPDDTWGEQVAAVIRIADGADRPSIEQLRAFCRSELSAHKTPAYWSFPDAMPRTTTGKLQKFVLRNLVTTGELSMVSPSLAHSSDPS
jgi:fatty-acyl-CoA synthase